MGTASIQSFLKALGTGVLDLVFPRLCLMTHQPMTEHSTLEWFSQEVYERDFYRIRFPCCCSCGLPFYGSVGVSRQCPSCVQMKPHFDAGGSLLMFRAAGRRLVHALKYQGIRAVSTDIRRLASENPEFLQLFENAILVPVPLHWLRLQHRGFNQSSVIAGCFAQASGKSLGVYPLLRRTRLTRTQTRLTRAQRSVNIKGAFAVSEAQLRRLSRHYARSEEYLFSGKEKPPVVIVDDVYTTGATLNECAKVLKKWGFPRVCIATLAHG